VSEELSHEDFLLACRLDPAWFIQYVMGVQNARLHDDIQAFLTETPDGYVEIPRNHGKTMQIAGRYAWEIGNNPDIRIKNVGSTDGESEKTVAMVKAMMETDRYKEVFPEIEPDPLTWGKTAITVKRKKMVRDPTLEAVGIMGRAGGRSDILCFDDICDLKNSVQQPALREAVKDSYKSLWLPTLDPTTPNPRLWRFATPWHIDDLTAEWRKRLEPKGCLLRRPCIETPAGDESPWPEVFTRQLLAERREEYGPVAYSRAYLLRPISSDEIVFPAEWFDRSMYRAFEIPKSVVDGGIRIASIDWAFSKKSMGKPVPDWSVFLVGLRDLTGTLWAERLFRVRTPFPEFCRLVASNARSLGVRQIIAEANGPQAGLVQQLREAVHIPVTDALRQVDKYSRACEKQTFVESGRFRLPRGGDGQVLGEFRAMYDEVTTFPASEKDDLTDSMVDLITLANRQGYGSSEGGYGGGVQQVPSGRPPLWRFGYK